ncbi:MAG: DUF4440 domain-containing protein [Candidatus Bathyarchaeota archaeon]|nr:DUF4440 domain-containing protein [Candidatus Bathyarchaeota archaeon]
MEDVRKEIEKVNMSFVENIRKSDVSKLARLYTKDTKLMPPNHATVTGREATKEYWKSAFGMGVKDAILTTDELTVSGDLANERGSYTMKIKPEGQDEIEDKGKYVVIWKKTEDGWKLHWDIFNSDIAPSE